MLKHKVYVCQICGTSPDQISHHKNHLESQKHKDKKELMGFRLSKLLEKELMEQYGTLNIDQIIEEKESFFYYIKKNNEENNFGNYEESSQIIDKSLTITNREALKDKIHEINNFLRNSGVGFGMNALKIFNIFYALKKIEDKGLNEKINMKIYFSNLLDKAKQKGDEIQSNILIEIIEDISQSKIKNLLYTDVPRNISNCVCYYLIKEIDKLSKLEETCNVLLSGKIYEYFIGRDDNSITELGAYFTDRHIVNYIYSKLDHKFNKIEKMIDMFGGSGGFTTGYIDYCNNKLENINWDDEINKIFHYDINEDVIKFAALEFFCLTGCFPNMNENLKVKNAFADNFSSNKFHYVITNPPYGGDKLKQSDSQLKRDKIKDFIKKELPNISDESTLKYRQRQLKYIESLEKQERKEADKTRVCLQSCSERIKNFAKDYSLSGNDKESCSLILMMELLDLNGTAIGVLKEGLFFNKTYKDLRRCLIDNFNVKEIISVPQDQFENTSTKTSIIIFENTIEKTSEVKFSELVIEKYEEDKFAEFNHEIVLIENKGDIKSVSEKLLSSVAVSEISENTNYSLNAKDYSKKKITLSKGYKLMKLGDLCNFIKYKSQKSSDGTYDYYSCSNIIKKCELGNITGEYIIIGSRGTISGSLHYCNGSFGCGDNMFVFNSNINVRYLYYTLNAFKNVIDENIVGSTIPMISLTQFKNIVLPFPISNDTASQWEEKISNHYDELICKRIKIKENESIVADKIREIGDNEKYVEQELGTLVETKSGEIISKSKVKNGIYPVYGGGNISSYIDSYNRENELIINKDAMKVDCVKFVQGKFFLNHHGWTLEHKKEEYKNYINYWLFSNQQKIYDNSNGSAQKGINRENFLKIRIKIPKKQILQDLEKMFLEIENLRDDCVKAEIKYKQLIEDLRNEALNG